MIRFTFSKIAGRLASFQVVTGFRMGPCVVFFYTRSYLEKGFCHTSKNKVNLDWKDAVLFSEQGHLTFAFPPGLG